MTPDRAEEERLEQIRLTHWIHAQRLPIAEMARMLVEERAGLREQIAALEKLHGLDLGRVIGDTLGGVSIGIFLAWLVC